MFGAPTSGGLFGGAASSGGGLFGGGASSGSIFGGGGTSSGSIFGGGGASSGSIFGGATSGGGGLFGGAASSGGGLFGGGTSGGSIFGGGGASSGGSIFGGATSGGGGLFGGAASSGSGLFGGGTSGGSIFGGGGASSGGSIFGGSSGSLFGASGGGSGSMFGAASSGSGPLPVDAQQQCINLQTRLTQMAPVLGRARSDQSSALGGMPQVQQSFLAFTYEWVDNPLMLQQASQFNPQYHIDQAKFAQAMQNNPDPRHCAPKRLLGLPDVKQRLVEQDGKMQVMSRGTEELEKAFQNLKASLQVNSLKKLEECRERHQQLSKQLLQVVAALETYAVLNGAARRNPHVEAQLEERFSRLEDAVHAPASARARLEELWVVLQSLRQRGPPVGGPARMSESEADRTLQLTGAQGELLEQLQEELARRNSDIQHFESTLQRFNSAPLAPQTI